MCNPQDPNKEVLSAAVAAVAPPSKSKRGLKSKLERKGSKGGSSARSLAKSVNETSSNTSRDGNYAMRVAASTIMATTSATSRSNRRDTIEEEHSDDDEFEESQSGRKPRSSGSSRRESFSQSITQRPSAVLGIDLKALDNDKTSDSASPCPIEERKALAQIHNPQNSAMDIINIMMTNSISTVIQNDGLHALSLAFRSPTASVLNAIQRGCGYEVIVGAMGKCESDAMAQTNACKVLFMAGAAGDEIHQIAIVSAGGLDALSDAMKNFNDDMIVLEGCLLALSNLCIPEKNMKCIFDLNLIEAVVEVMSTTVENCGLQEHGCAVLANLALHDEARDRIRDSGGCDTIVVSMVVNPMDVEVQSQALAAVRNLCAKDEEIRVLFANSGGIDAIIGAMQCHRNDTTIQERGSWVLSILGANNENKMYIGENGGIDVIVRSMCVHPDDAGVQEKALRALWTLSVAKELRFPIVEVNTISATVAAMQAHSEDAAVQEKGCGILTNLAATSSQLKVQIVKEGSLEAAVMAMVLHGENEMLTERAVSLIKKLCIPENTEEMMMANIAPMMTMVAESFPRCREKAHIILDFLGEGDVG